MNLSVRDENILLTLDKLGYATTSQIQRIHELGSVRNAQRIMQRLYSYTNTKKMDENVFYLNKKGRELIGTTKVRSATTQLQHAVMRSEAYLIFNMPDLWMIERPITVDNKPFIIPDVTFGFNSSSDRYLVEVDCHQHMRNNYSKLDKYVDVKEMAKGKLPNLVWLTRTKYRKEKLEKAMQKRNLQHYIYSLEDIK